jgi:alkanesulfonate monooxygenase SsuD/methylene tetrahydromethanopterin reductase-like flavin-dependent oxidoreductase (luciferase family)
LRNHRIKIGILLPTRGELIYSSKEPNFQNIIDMAEAIEGHNYHSIWVGDSVTSKPRFEAITTLAAVAARTKKPILGTAVLLSGLRNPTILAHQIATLDRISRGRVFLGVGVGGGDSKNLITEFPACGIPYSNRVDYFELGLEVMKKCWIENNISISNKIVTLNDITIEPKPVQKGGPPIHIAGAHFGILQEKQLKRIAKYGDGFMSTLIRSEEYSLAFEKIAQFAKGFGRKPQSLGKSLYMSINLNKDKRKATEEANDFLTKYYGYNFWDDRWGPFGPSSEILKSIEEFVDIGVEVFVIRFAARDQRSQLEIFTKEVYPSF